jgi:hypothetical protein
MTTSSDPESRAERPARHSPWWRVQRRLSSSGLVVRCFADLAISRRKGGARSLFVTPRTRLLRREICDSELAGDEVGEIRWPDPDRVDDPDMGQLAVLDHAVDGRVADAELLRDLANSDRA